MTYYSHESSQRAQEIAENIALSTHAGRDFFSRCEGKVKEKNTSVHLHKMGTKSNIQRLEKHKETQI